VGVGVGVGVGAGFGVGLDDGFDGVGELPPQPARKESETAPAHKDRDQFCGITTSCNAWTGPSEAGQSG
jgi:hypothetical protein